MTGPEGVATYTSAVDVPALRSIVAASSEAFVEDLRTMVNVDCGSYTPSGVNRIADLCEARFRAGEWAVERTTHAPGSNEPQLGDLVIGRLTGAGGPKILVVGHMDTVFDEGTAAERPFRIEGDVAYGPGVSDMKGGLLTGFAAVEALQEVGSPFSGPVIRELAPQHDVAFVLEGARANGDIVSARKGITDFRIDVTGRAAHAGVEPEKGRNAILEAAHLTIAIQALHGRWPGVTVNVGVIRGGTRTNVVPEHCELHVDVRSPEAETLDAAVAEVERICAAHTVPDVTAVVHANGWHRPMEKRDGGARLVDIAVEVAAELGFEVRDAATGGASDANTTSAAGTPTLDGLGPVGGDDHAPGEWLDLSSVVPRVSLLAGIVTRL